VERWGDRGLARGRGKGFGVRGFVVGAVDRLFGECVGGANGAADIGIVAVELAGTARDLGVALEGEIFLVGNFGQAREGHRDRPNTGKTEGNQHQRPLGDLHRVGVGIGRLHFWLGSGLSHGYRSLCAPSD
jgi:hypothetical protein